VQDGTFAIAHCGFADGLGAFCDKQHCADILPPAPWEEHHQLLLSIFQAIVEKEHLGLIN
jgi:hypothetical protein